MKLSTWNGAIKTWLEGQIDIDSWLLDNPVIGQTSAYIPPMRESNYTLEDFNAVRGYGIQDIILLRRYPKSLAYKDLPIGALEGLQASLSVRLATQYEDIADLRRLEVLTVPDPVSAEEMGDRLGDWVVRLHWAFSLTWDAEVEDEPLGNPFTITGISADLWREYINESNSILDTTLDITGT